MLMTFVLIWFFFIAPRLPQQQPPNIDKPIDQQHQEQDEQAETKDPPDPDEPDQEKIAATEAEPAWVTLGSMNPDSPYQMLITFTNRGAAPCRIELNNTSQYRDVQELSGYLGQIVADQVLAEKDGDGVIVQVLGHGTPVQVQETLEVGDKIVKIAPVDWNTKTVKTAEAVDVKTFADLRNALQKTKPNDFVELTFLRNNRPMERTVKLGQYPMDVIRPESVPKNYEEYRQMGGLRGVEEKSDQLSFLMTLQQINEQQLDLPANQQKDNSRMHGMIPPDETLARELPGVALRNECWEIVPDTPENEVKFRRSVPEHNLEVTKTYRLQKRDEVNAKNKAGAGYELTLNITVKNRAEKAQKVAYQLDGPTGLPLEGGWYALKFGHAFFASYGIRDIIVRLHGNESHIVPNSEIQLDKAAKPWIDASPEYLGIDSIYFQCTLKTDESAAAEPWHSKIFPIRVGTKNTDWSRLTDVSFRLWSKAEELPPGEQLEHTYTIFAGPKDTVILAENNLGHTLYYGWFWFAAIPLLGILHFFHSLGLSYAMAIILLTVCVRLLLFPLSRKQAAGAIKMQQIQPELKALAEKYKDDLQARSRAQSELFKKHNFHPASGCLPIFIQLPIFIGLYKALTIDAGLYGAPLIATSVRWCSDLSAPDRLFDWSNFWNGLGWTSFNTGQGMFALGPYFNLLPILTIILFIIQMVYTMPPPTDEQSRMQRKVFQFMMVFMGFLFFKMPSGLCLYFIISTVWGLAERQFIPKPQPKKPGETLDVDVVPDGGQKPTESKNASVKKGGKSRAGQPAQKQEGRFAKWWREVLEKAAEQQKLGQVKRNEDDNHKKKKKMKR